MRTIEKVGIVGAGTMGAGIMINCVTSGLEVTLVDRSPEVLEKASAKLARYLSRQVEKGRMTQAGVAPVLNRLSVATEMPTLSDRDLVIEAVFENLDLKKAIFGDLENHVSEACVLATNTSCLRLADIADVLDQPGRFCGMHYFSPAEINPVVELIQGAQTDADVLARADGFLKATSKEVIACKDQNGFALNRFFCPYSNEAVHLLDEGLGTTGQIDEVAKNVFGLALGPFAVMNIIGRATNLNAVRNLSPLGPFYTPAPGLVAQGAHNTPWEIEGEPEPLEPGIRQIMADRFVNSVLLPVTEELNEGVATLDAINRGAGMAFRFGISPGELMAELGDKLHDRLAAFAQGRGHPAPVV